MNKAQLIDTVKKLLNDSATPELWSLGELETYYEQTAYDFCITTELIRESIDIEVKAASNLVDYPSNILRISHISFNGTDLVSVPFEAVKSILSESGEVKYYVVDYIPNKVLLIRKPEKDGVLSINGPVISKEIPNKYLNSFVYGMLSKAFQKTDSETISPMAEKYHNLWLLELNKLKTIAIRNTNNPFNVMAVHPGLI